MLQILGTEPALAQGSNDRPVTRRRIPRLVGPVELDAAYESAETLDPHGDQAPSGTCAPAFSNTLRAAVPFSRGSCAGPVSSASES